MAQQKYILKFAYFGVLYLTTLDCVVSTNMTLGIVANIHDKIVNQNIGGEFFGVRTAARCLEVCSEDDYCLTFFYHAVEKFCQTHSVVFSINSTWEDRPGTVYYHRIYPHKCYSLDYIYHPGLKFCYRIAIVQEAPLNWTEARQACQREGGDLIVFDTMDKYNHINQTLHANTYLTEPGIKCFQVGVHKVGNDWFWINGTPLLLSDPMWEIGGIEPGEPIARSCSRPNFHLRSATTSRTSNYICQMQ